MENNLSKASTDKQPYQVIEYTILDAFNEAYNHETLICNPDDFRATLEDIVIQKINECQTPEEYVAFDSQLKQDIVRFMDNYGGCDPWDTPTNEPGVAEYIKTAILFVDNKEEFVNSDKFTTGVVEYAFLVAPFSIQKVSDLIALTDTDVSEKIHDQISTTLDDPKHESPSFVWGSYEIHKEKTSLIVGYHNLLKLFPSEELSSKCTKYAKEQLEHLFYDSLSENSPFKLPEWDEIDEKELLGFDPDEIWKIVEPKIRNLHWKNEIKGIQWSIETDDVINNKSQKIVGELIGVEFGLESEIDDFLNEKIKQYIANIPKPTYEEFAASETNLVTFAKAVDLEQELIQMYNEEIIDYDISNFTENNLNRIASLRWKLCDITGSENDLTKEYIAFHDELDEDDATIEQIRKKVRALYYDTSTSNVRNDQC